MSKQPHVEIHRVLHASAVSAIPTATGPVSLLDAGLVNRLRKRGCAVRVSDVAEPAGRVAGGIARSFAVASGVATGVERSFANERLPIVLSGSCHTALGSVAGLPGDRNGVVWLDAHGDFNTPDTTPSGLLDGTTLATITGRCWRRLRSSVPGFVPIDDAAVVTLGVRDLDPGEASLLEASDIVVLPAGPVDGGFDAAIERLRDSVDAVYVHLDLDVLDPVVGKANDYAAPGGLSATELKDVLDTVRRAFPVRALGITSYDPSVDITGGARAAALDAAIAFVVEP